jgi:methionyl aminopeptidase
MSLTNEAEWTAMREVGRVVRIVLDALEQRTRAGVTTGELDAVAAATFRAHHARSAPALVYNFPGHVLISVNDEVVHGIPRARTLAPGDVVKLDVTAEKDGFMADAARTLVVPGGRNPDALRLRDCAEAAFAKALAVVRPGTPLCEIGRAIEGEVRRCGFSVIRELAGHSIGRTIHESPSVLNYFNPGETDLLTNGLVLAIEPIICSGSGRVVEDRDGWTIRTKDGSLAAHYEHTVVVSADGPVLLTAA